MFGNLKTLALIRKETTNQTIDLHLEQDVNTEITQASKLKKPAEEACMYLILL